MGQVCSITRKKSQNIYTNLHVNIKERRERKKERKKDRKKDRQTERKFKFFNAKSTIRKVTLFSRFFEQTILSTVMCKLIHIIF